MNMYGRILYYGTGLNTSHRRTSGREGKSEGEGWRADGEKREGLCCRLFKASSSFVLTFNLAKKKKKIMFYNCFI